MRCIAGKRKCEFPLFPDNCNVELVGISPGDIAIFQCYIGYVFPAGGIFRTSVCLGDGSWSVTVDDCKRKRDAIILCTMIFVLLERNTNMYNDIRFI